MKIIVLEGLDGTGKNTQARLLKENLKKLGFTVELVSFPQYDESYNENLIRALQTSGEIKTSEPFSFSMPFALDRKRYFSERVSKPEPDFLIADRYTTSNFIYQGAKCKTQQDLEEYLKKIEAYEYEELGIPKPDMVIYLDMPTEISTELVDRRSREQDIEKDIYEGDFDYQAKVHRLASKLSKDYNWEVIDCIRDTDLRNPDDINKEIIEKVVEKLGV